MYDANIYLIGFLLLLLVQGSYQEKIKKPPKIVTKDGSLVLKAGEDGDIILEPDDGRQVRIGSFVLNENSTSSAVQGSKGDKGAPGVKGAKGQIGLNGMQGLHGIKGDPGSKGARGKDGNDGLKGGRGDPGPPGAKGERFNLTAIQDCSGSKDYGQMKYTDNNLQVCTAKGWKTLSFKEDLCPKPSVPRINLEYFQRCNFGALFQFNGDLKVDLSPNTTAKNANITTAYQNPASSQVTTPEYVDSAVGKAIRLSGRQHIDVKGLPTHLWSADEWSVMALIKLNSEGLNSLQEIPVVGSGTQQKSKGFHIGFRAKRTLYGFYSNDLQGVTQLNYDQWYQITWTWKKEQTTGKRQIFINGVLEAQDSKVIPYQDVSDNTEIGAWWDDTLNRSNNITINTLFIIDKAVDYRKNFYSDSLEICEAKAVDNDMP